MLPEGGHAVTLADTAKALLQELKSTQLVVTLAPAKRGAGKVRVVMAENPKWYRDFCRTYTSYRQDLGRWRIHKTKIKRRETLRALTRIAKGETRGVYVGRLLPVIQTAMTEDAERAAYEARAFAPIARSYVPRGRR